MKDLEIVGDIIEKMKSIEYYLDCIIHNFILPHKNIDFFRNVILHSSIISLGAKLKIVKSISVNYDINLDFSMDKVHKMLNIRNIFAHQSAYVEHPENISKMDKLNASGKYIQCTPEELYSEFDRLYHEEINNLIKFSEQLSEKIK